MAKWHCSVLVVPPKNPKNCWICGKPVTPEDPGLDELGFPVHDECNRPWAERERPQRHRRKHHKRRSGFGAVRSVSTHHGLSPGTWVKIACCITHEDRLQAEGSAYPNPKFPGGSTMNSAGFQERGTIRARIRITVHFENIREFAGGLPRLPATLKIRPASVWSRSFRRLS